MIGACVCVHLDRSPFRGPTPATTPSLPLYTTADFRFAYEAACFDASSQPAAPVLLTLTQYYDLLVELVECAWCTFGADTLVFIEMPRAFLRTLPAQLLDGRVWIGDRADDEEADWRERQTADFVVVRSRLCKDLFERGDNTLRITCWLRAGASGAAERYLERTRLRGYRRESISSVVNHISTGDGFYMEAADPHAGA